ncbi:MAG TPA: MAPEG family protein [Porticoccaceae bacterium]|nr:MAPEG family protein [Porticoccaceae bacterium]HIG67207.1 MAPEG family protein [Porticoccaceae bacterium]HIK79380.1 MAPEG family protein [Porticoccaceae bacterium]
MGASEILQPVIALGLWSGVMMIWMYATRVPAISKADIPAAEMGHPGGMKYLPSEVRRIADNYNHLFEQPTLFYATCIAIAVAGHVDAMAVNVAWAFVIIRVVHSLVQATINIVLLRFGIFLLSWVALLVLLIREALVIF